MSYFKDLSLYSLFKDEWRDTMLNVGWLSARHSFLTAHPSAEFLDKLWQYCLWSFAQTRGCHTCEMCDEAKGPSFGPTEVTHNGLMLSLGDAEIRVFGHGGKIYAAPNLIWHYVVEHQYSPPDEFVEAVLRSPGPCNAIYFNRVKKLKLEWEESYTPQDEEGWERRRQQRMAQPERPCVHLPSEKKV